ncbi:MAG: HEAT repeat domain-containing protein [bacterium]
MSTNPSPPETDLPPVEPPDASFIVQLFVIPAVVVCVVIAVWLLFGKLAGGERDVNEYVRVIRSENANRRFRAAYELASLISNEKQLQTDPKLLGDLAELLETELAQTSGDNTEARQYLALTLGVFQISEGTASSGKPANALTVLAQALGDNQPMPVRISATESLARQAARQDGIISAENVVGPLAKAAEAAEPEVRLRAVYALGFCGGDTATSALRKRLPDPERDVAYNAAFALIRRDDRQAADILRELLDAKTLEANIKLENATEKQNRIEAFQLQALKSLHAAVDKKLTTLATLTSLEVESLTKSPFVSVSVEAKSLLEAIGKAPKNS